jgi:hypothetical protein
MFCALNDGIVTFASQGELEPNVLRYRLNHANCESRRRITLVRNYLAAVIKKYLESRTCGFPKGPPGIETFGLVGHGGVSLQQIPKVQFASAPGFDN